MYILYTYIFKRVKFIKVKCAIVLCSIFLNPISFHFKHTVVENELKIVQMLRQYCQIATQ